MVDINNLLSMMTQSTAQSNQRIGDLSGEMAANTEQVGRIFSENVPLQRELIDQTQQLGREQADLNYTNAKSREDAQAMIGLSREDADNEFARSVAGLTVAQKERAQVRGKINELNSVGFFDNPVGYILNQMELPTLVQKHNNLVDAETTAAQNIETRTKMLQQYNSTTVAAGADTQRLIDYKKAKIATDAAQVQLNEQQIRNLSTISEQKLRVANLADKMGDNLARLYNTQMSAEQFNMAQEERKELRAMRAEETRMRLSDKKTKQEAKSKLDGDIANISTLLGQVNADGTPKVDSVEALQTVIRDNKKRDAWGTAAMTGSLGENFQESLGFFLDNVNTNYMQTNRTMLMQAAKGMVMGVNSQYNDLNKMDPKTGKVPDPKEISKQAPNAYAVMVSSAAALRDSGGRTLTDAQFDSVFNPYRAPHAAMLTSIGNGGLQGFKDNVMYDAVKNVAAAKSNGGNFKGADEQEAFKVVGELVKARKITPAAAAAQVKRYYDMATRIADDAYGTTTLFQLPKQTSYAATIEVPGRLWGADALRVDLLNQGSIERALAKYVATGRGAGTAASSLSGEFIANPAFTSPSDVGAR